MVLCCCQQKIDWHICPLHKWENKLSIKWGQSVLAFTKKPHAGWESETIHAVSQAIYGPRSISGTFYASEPEVSGFIHFSNLKKKKGEGGQRGRVLKTVPSKEIRIRKGDLTPTSYLPLESPKGRFTSASRYRCVRGSTSGSHSGTQAPFIQLLCRLLRTQSPPLHHCKSQITGRKESVEKPMKGQA